MSGPLPGDAEIVLQLSLSEASSHGSYGGRSPIEEQTLALFDALREPLLRYLLSLRLAPERSEEILQDTFLKLFEHLKSSRPDSNIRGWLFREASVFDLALKPAQDTGPNPEQQMILDQREARLLAALHKLPDTEQRCLHLRAEGLRYREISEVLHIGVSTVADCLHRAIGAIRKDLHG
jgi:RNA polymerase sigma-70 factor (ECF subfamily)